MSKWLRCDCAGVDSYLQKTGLGLTVGSGFTAEIDLVVPAATLSTIFTNLGSGSGLAEWLYVATGSNHDGITAFDTTGTPTWQFTADQFGGPAAGTLTGDVNLHLKYAVVWNGGSGQSDITVSLNGSAIFTYSTSAFLTASVITTLRVGGFASDHQTGEIYYVDNVVLKDGSGSTVFSDDFESGTTAAWTTTFGSVSVVDFTPAGGGGGGPANTDCASAVVLVGCGGIETADNTGWAGTWPTGADPLFNAEGVGGGAPMWWSWTNPRSRRMLFRFQVTAAPGSSYNAGIGVGACGALDFTAFDTIQGDGLNEEGGDTIDGTYHDHNLFSGSTTYFEILVDPGDTVFFEIDSYSPGQTTEPPSAAGHQGSFTFTWSSYNYTTLDSSQGNTFVFSDLLVNNFSPISDPAVNTSGLIDPRATLVVGDRLYLLWEDPQDTHGTSLYVGDCALDGSGLNTQKIRDAATVPVDVFGVGDVPRLFTDGSYVFVTYGCWIEAGTETDTSGVGYTSPPSYQNPDFPDSCGAHVGVYFFCFGEGEGTVANVFRYDVWRFAGAGSWTRIKSIGEDHDSSMGFVPDMGHSAAPGLGTDIVVRSHAVDGVVWVQAAYRVVRDFQSFHVNDYPLFETPPKSIYVTSDHKDLYEYEDTYTVDLSGACVLVNRNENHLAELQHWDHDDPTVDPAFGIWQFFDDGNFFTDPAPSTHYPSVRYRSSACELRCDEGYPILAYVAEDYVFNDSNFVGDSYEVNSVRLKRVDTDAAVANFTYDDFRAGAPVSSVSDATCDFMTFSQRFRDPLDGLWRRQLGTRWTGDVAAVSWMDKVVSDGSGVPAWIAGVEFLSSREDPAATFLPDITKKQWWMITGTVATDGASHIALYEHCDEGWHNTYTSSALGDGLSGSAVFSERAGWKFDTPDTCYFWIINHLNQLRRVKVLRDFFICAAGAPCGDGLYSWQLF